MASNRQRGTAAVPNGDIPSTPETADETKLLETLNAEGGEANNFTLMHALSWDPARYWAVRNRLKDSGRVQIRRGGPGGTTFIPPAPIEVPEAPVAGGPQPGAPARAENEAALYGPMLDVLEKSWVGDQGYDSSIIRQTALAGRRDTGGTWTRPDLCIVAIRKFKFLRDPVFDVVSFEVKPNWAISVEGVFEALAHRQYATRAYVIYHVSDKDFAAQPEAERITELAEQHGIGVILAETPDDYQKWTERVRARRWALTPMTSMSSYSGFSPHLTTTRLSSWRSS
jgi:hypothetical protein